MSKRTPIRLSSIPLVAASIPLVAASISLVAVAGLVLATAGTALAEDPAPALDQAKKAGVVGERPDGFVGPVRPDLEPGVAELIERINEQRRAKYQEIAVRNRIPVDQVGAVAGEKLKQRTPEGLFVQDAKGNWIRK